MDFNGNFKLVRMLGSNSSHVGASNDRDGFDKSVKEARAPCGAPYHAIRVVCAFALRENGRISP